MLVQASQGGLAWGAISALAGSQAAAQVGKQPDAPAAASAATIPVTDFERSCLRFRIDTTKKPAKEFEEELAKLVTRDAMIGVVNVKAPVLAR